MKLQPGDHICSVYDSDDRSCEQRKRWFCRGFDSGDARQCDTFAVQNHRAL